MESDWIKWLRERAYEFGEEVGRPDGRHEDHWRRAEAELERTLLRHAEDVATRAHEGQTDKLGSAYIRHCERVAAAVSTNDEKIVAYLHDVAEKGPGWTLDRLDENGFPTAIIEAVDALTRRTSEDDREFVKRAWSNQLARPVKEADLRDNLHQAELAGLETAKYQQGLETFYELQSEVDRVKALLCDLRIVWAAQTRSMSFFGGRSRFDWKVLALCPTEFGSQSVPFWDCRGNAYTDCDAG